LLSANGGGENYAESADGSRSTEQPAARRIGARSRKRIETYLEPVEFKLGEMVCDAGGLLKHAYFSQGSVLSLLTVLKNGAAIEAANIGREGAFGLFAAIYSRVSFNRCIVQLEGHAARCPIELLQDESKQSEHVRDLFVSYRRRCSRRSSKRSPATRCTRPKNACAARC
jgi:hypothetical protein